MLNNCNCLHYFIFVESLPRNVDEVLTYKQIALMSLKNHSRVNPCMVSAGEFVIHDCTSDHF